MLSHRRRQYVPARLPAPHCAHPNARGRGLRHVGLALSLAVVALGRPALAGPGDLDGNFAGFSGGIVQDGLCFAGMAVMADGRIVVAGSSGNQVEVRRYMANGVLDPSFSSDGIVVSTNPDALSVTATCVAVSSAGRVVVGGSMLTIPTDYFLACFTASGVQDGGFGTLGWVRTDFDHDTDGVEAVAFQSDGKVLAAGSSRIAGDFDFSVARYSVFGTLDPSFSGDGKATVPFGGNDLCHNMALQPDGKIVLVGGAFTTSGNSDFALARLNTNGSLDNSFAGDGKFIPPLAFGTDEEAFGVAIQSDGKIIASGFQGPDDGRLLRVTPSGSLDSSFDGDGLAYDLNNTCEAVAVQLNGSIIVAGLHISPDQDGKAAFHRFASNGAFDPSLADGAEYIDLGSSDDRCRDVAVLLDGRIIGNCEFGGSGALLQIWPNGDIDTGGRQTVGFEDNFTQQGLLKDSVDVSCVSMAPQSDGKLVLLGEVANKAFTAKDMALTRLMQDGTVDASFGTNGHVQFGPFLFDQPRTVAIQPDDKIVIGGHLVAGSVINFMIARLNPNGSVDGTFGFGGINAMDLGGDDLGSAMALAPDGKIVVVGTVYISSVAYFGVARFNADGTPDNTFDADAKLLYGFGSFAAVEASAVVVQADRKIVVGGTVDGNFAMIRLNENGSVDNVFGIAGRSITDMGSSDDHMNALVLASGGFFYAAGYRNLGGNYDFAVAQYTGNGQLATCSGSPCNNWPTGKAFVDFGGGDIAYAADVRSGVRSDGRVVVAGRGNSQMAWAQFGPLSSTPLLTGLADFLGTSESAKAVRMTGLDWIVVAGSQSFSETHMAAARFWGAPGIIASGVEDPPPAQVDGSARILSAYPNPLAGRATISFALPREELVRLRIYDAAGRLVRVLAEERLPAGIHERMWDGTDDRGRSVAAGVYFSRLEASGSVQNKSLIVLR
jgi:uncharacterized delta-60 repeat protein